MWTLFIISHSTLDRRGQLVKMDFSLSEICELLGDSLEKYAKKRKLERLSSGLYEKKFKTSTPLSLTSRVKFNFKASPIKSATSPITTSNTPVNTTQTLVNARNTPVNTTQTLVNAWNTPVNTTQTLVNARNTPVNATITSVNATNVGSARTTPRVQNPPLPPTPRNMRPRLSGRPRVLVYEDSDEEIDADV